MTSVYPESPPEKFLSGVFWPGWMNNTRMSFETMVIWAFLLDRTLIIPDTPAACFSDRFVEPTPHPAEVFDLDLLRKGIKFVSSRFTDPNELNALLAYLSAKKEDGWDYLDIELADACTSVLCHPSPPEDCLLERERLTHFMMDRPMALELPRDHADYEHIHISTPQLEHFYAYFFLDPGKERSCKVLIRDYLKFNPAILELARMAVTRLGSFAAVHIRRTDFKTAYPSQIHEAEALFDAISIRVPLGSSLYIASDEPDRKFFGPLTGEYRTFFIEDALPEASRQVPACWIAAVEQLICASASVFVGTRLSTFSGYITRLRGYAGGVDLGIYFTDGESAVPALPAGHRYTWQASLEAGTPLWAREYEEAWKV